jgi:hypothetical protein
VVDRERGVALAAGHALADGVDEHGERDQRRDQQHQRGEPVGDQRDAERLLPGADPEHLGAVAVGLVDQHGGDDDHGGEHRGADQPL